MQKEMLSQKQAVCLLSMFLFGSTVVIGAGRDVEQDAWVVLLIAMLAFVPLGLVYARILKLFPEQNLFEIFEHVFGKFFGKVLTLLMTWYAFHLGSLVIRNYSEYIKIVTLQETPQIPLMIALALIAIYMTKAGIEVLGRWSVITLPIVFAVIIGTTILSVNKMEYTNILPAFVHNAGVFAFSSLKTFSFPYAESVLLMILGGSIRRKDNPRNIILLSVGLATLAFLIINLRNLFVLGVYWINISYFPSYEAAQLIDLGDFLTRIEGSISMNFILAGISKITVCLLATSIGLSRLFGIENTRTMIVPSALLMLSLSPILYENTMEMFDFIDYYPFYAAPFQILIPLATWITAEIRSRVKKKNPEQVTVQPRKLSDEGCP